jgi:hypothetical protein
MGEALGRFALATAATAAAVGALGALIAWATGHGIAAGVTGAYYVIGSLLFLVGTFPTGGFSFIRGTNTRRKPVGARQEPVFAIGIVLVAIGVAVDLRLF